MGGGPSYKTSNEWEGTNEQLADMLMPLYYVRNVVVTSDDIDRAKASWQLIIDGNIPAFEPVYSNNSLILHSEPLKPIESCISWFTNIFYSRLFDVNPASKILFKDSMSSKTKVLNAIINTALSQLIDPIYFVETLTHLAHAHVQRNIKGVQFGIAGDVLLWSFKTALGPLYDDDLHWSWTKIYSAMLKVIVPIAIGDERDIYRKNKLKGNGLSRRFSV